MLVFVIGYLTDKLLNLINWKLSVWRSGRKPATQQQEGLSSREGGASESGDVVSTEGVALKELKDAEGTGLNALWPIRQHWQKSMTAGLNLDQSDGWSHRWTNENQREAHFNSQVFLCSRNFILPKKLSHVGVIMSETQFKLSLSTLINNSQQNSD